MPSDTREIQSRLGSDLWESARIFLAHFTQSTMRRDRGAPVKKGELGCMRRDPSRPLRWSALRIPRKVAHTPSRAIDVIMLTLLPSFSSSSRRTPRFKRFSSAPGDGMGRASGLGPWGSWAGEWCSSCEGRVSSARTSAGKVERRSSESRRFVSLFRSFCMFCWPARRAPRSFSILSWPEPFAMHSAT